MDLCFELATQIMARIGDAVSPVDEVHGFRYFDDRDLLGFVDGTENPQGRGGDRRRAHRRRRTPAFAGGSYVIVQKYLHDLDGMERAAPPRRRSASSAAPSSPTSNWTTPSSRPRRTARSPRSSRTGKRSRSCATTCRSAAPRQGEFGTYFIGYSRSPRTIEQMLENMFVGRPPGNYDRLLDFSRAVTGNLFFVPSATFLENVQDDEPAAAVAESSTPAADRTISIDPIGARWFARHRLPQRRHPT